MPRSVRITLGLVLATGLLSCATARHQPPIPKSRTATMEVAPEQPVVAQALMPPGFEPIPFRPPMWLDNGRAVAVVGTLRGRTMLVEYARSGFDEPRVLAADHMPGASDATLADVALSPGHSSFAIALLRPDKGRLEILRRDAAAREAESLFSLNGKFDSTSVGWPDDKTVALAVIAPTAASTESRTPVATPSPTSPPSPAPTPGPSAAATPAPAATPSPTPAPPPVSTLYLIPSDGSGKAEKIQLTCAITAMNWSPNGAYAVSQGAAAIPAAIFDRKNKSCTAMNVAGPVHVIQWAPKDKRFLYTAPIPSGPIATFQFDIATGQSRLIALSSSAAVYLRANSVLALGNQRLTLRRLRERSDGIVVAELAVIDPGQINIRVEPLGIQTMPDMLASSLMTYSGASGTAAIEMYAPGGLAALRHIIAFSPATGRAALLASGSATGIALMSWSPNGRVLAIFDGDSRATALTLIAPVIPKHGAAPAPLGVPPPLAPIPPGV